MRDSEVLVTHHRSLMELSHNIRFIEMPRPRKLAALMELCTRLLGVKRASVWLFPPERDRITCEWLHDQEQPISRKRGNRHIPQKPGELDNAANPSLPKITSQRR